MKNSTDVPEMKLFKMDLKKAENKNANNISSQAPEMKMKDLFKYDGNAENGQTDKVQLSKSGMSVMSANSPLKSQYF